MSGPPQDIQPLSIQAVSPDVQLKDSRGLMSPSQGLLATTDSAVDQRMASSLNYAPQLLQLNPSLLTSDAPSAQASPPCRPEHRGNTQLRNAACPGLRGHLAFSSAHDPAPSRVMMSETPRSQELPLPVIPSPTPAPPQGLRLLHCHSPPQNHVSAPKLPRLPSFRPGPGISILTADVPIKLLQIESGPKMVSLGTFIFLGNKILPLSLTLGKWASNTDAALADSAGAAPVHGGADWLILQQAELDGASTTAASSRAAG